MPYTKCSSNKSEYCAYHAEDNFNIHSNLKLMPHMP